MPPPETKSISFQKPSLLTLGGDGDGHSPMSSTLSMIMDLDKAMIPTPLRTMLKDISGNDLIGMVLLPQFGYLYVALNHQLLEYEFNLLDNQARPFQIKQQLSSSPSSTSTAGVVRIAPKGIGTPVLFEFGTNTSSNDNNNSEEECLAQAQKVAKEMESLLGYPITIVQK